MKVYKYASHAAYLAAQEEANLRKIEHVWVMPETVEEIARRTPYQVDRVLCHGTRNGAEQRLFRIHYPKAQVIGTEIAPTAARFSDTVQHDFHLARAEWLEWADIVYSNSWDHSYDPFMSLSTWRAQLKLGRRLYLEHCDSEGVNVCTASDPLLIEKQEIRQMLGDCGFVLIDSFRAHGGGRHKSLVYVAERSL